MRPGLVLTITGFGFLAGCGGDKSAPPPQQAAPTYTVGGTVSGLSGSVTLANNGGDARTVSASGAFTFATPLANAAAYSVTVATQPANQTCTVGGGSGTVASANVSGVAVTCVTNQVTIGGTITGLAGSGLVLQNNAGDNLARNADGAFTFATSIASGTNYAVTVKSQPANPVQVCTVSAGSGTATANVANVAIACQRDSFAIGGTISGVAQALVLQLNGANDYTSSTTGTFTFAAVVQGGKAYDVTIKTQPASPALPCTIANGSGTVGDAPVTNIEIHCPATPPPPTLAWQAPSLISDSGSTAYDTYDYQVVANEAGDAMAVWTRLDDDGYRVQANRYRHGLGWQGVETIGAVVKATGRVFNRPRAAINRNGNAVVVWELLNDFGFGNPTRTDIVSNYYDTVAGWGSVVSVETDDGGSGFMHGASEPTVTLSDAGVATAAWLQAGGNDDVTRVMTNTSSGSGWSVPHAGFTDVLASVGGAEIAGNANGDAVLVWLGRDGSLFHAMAALVSGGVSGTTVILDTDPSSNSARPAVAVLPNGNAIAAWASENTGGVMVNERINASWTGAVRRSGDSDRMASQVAPPKIVSGSNGNALVAWPGVASGGSSGSFIAALTGGSWGASQWVVSSSPNGGFDAALNSSGQRMVIWRVPGAAAEIHATSSYDLDLSNNATLSTNGTGPKIALGGDGVGVAIWIQSDGTANRVWAAEYR